MEKVCRSCMLTKGISEFYKHPMMADGHLNKCKECQKKNSTDNRNKNIDQRRAYDRERASLPHRVEARKHYGQSQPGKKSAERARLASKIKFPNKFKARYSVSNALRDGRLIKTACFCCGDSKVEAHHPDYNSPLDVVWLCRKHHKEIHKEHPSF